MERQMERQVEKKMKNEMKSGIIYVAACGALLGAKNLMSQAFRGPGFKAQGLRIKVWSLTPYPSPTMFDQSLYKAYDTTQLGPQVRRA